MNVRPGFYKGSLWVGPNLMMTVNCADLANPRHGMCTGWVAPLLNGARECHCECHDEARMSYAAACVIIKVRIGEAMA